MSFTSALNWCTLLGCHVSFCTSCRWLSSCVQSRVGSLLFDMAALQKVPLLLSAACFSSVKFPNYQLALFPTLSHWGGAVRDTRVL